MMVYKKIMVGLFLTVILSGCAAPLIIGGGATVGLMASREKGVSGTMSDSQISVVVKSNLYSFNPDLHAKVGVNVQSGEVLLTGSVPDAQWQVEAERLAWGAKGVKSVLNNIEISEGGTLGSVASDSWITTQVKSQLLFGENIRSLNYSIKTVGAIVYLMGTAQTQEELDRVLKIISSVSSVKKVMNYVKVSGDSD
jgi:osmotically-inducible protein OsmY